MIQVTKIWAQASETGQGVFIWDQEKLLEGQKVLNLKVLFFISKTALL